MEIILIFSICLFASIIQSATGFGYAIIAMALLPLFMEFRVALTLVVILSTLTTFQGSLKLKNNINKNIMLPIIIGSLLIRPIGLYFAMNAQIAILKVFLGITLILTALFFIFYNKKLTIKPSKTNGFACGAVSGILGGLYNIGGPPQVLFFLSTTTSKEEYNATIQATSTICGLYTVLLHIFYGNVNQEVLQLLWINIIAVVLGTVVGLKIFGYIRERVLKNIIYYFILLMGVVTIIKG